MQIDLPKIPQAFVWKRLHSLMGIWLTAFLTLHLFTNSQAALLIGDEHSGFIRSVNDIHNLPYLLVIELLLLGIPFFVHIVWGIQYLRTAAFNSGRTDGSSPSLTGYSRNHGYTWQRLTAWVLIFLVAGHVIQMRFLGAPLPIEEGHLSHYLISLHEDAGLPAAAERVGATLHTPAEAQTHWPQMHWAETAPSSSSAHRVIAAAPNFGAAELLMVRETFKAPLMLLIYTVLVLSACFHGFNGLWTFCITWGVTLSATSQNAMRLIALSLMLLVTLLGLTAIWGTYFTLSP